MTSRIHDLIVRSYLALMHSPRQSPRELIRQLRQDDTGGMTSETVIIVAILVVVAIGVVTLIGTKIMDKAKGISF
jgi:Flp pilus assembly pilin Flp